MARLLDDKTVNELKKQFNDSLKNDVLVELVKSANFPEYTDFSKQFLEELSEIDNRIKIKIIDANEFSDPELKIENTPSVFVGRDKGYKIEYLGAPAGYEAQSLIETIIHVSREDHGFSKELVDMIDHIDQNVLLEAYVTPSCPYCPKSSILNNRIAIAKKGLVHSKTVEAGENMELARRFSVSSVPQQVINRINKSITVGVQPEKKYIKLVLKYGCSKYDELFASSSKETLPDNPDSPITVTDDNFEAALEKYPLLLVDFWAEWCAPCKMIGPVVAEIAKEYQGKIVIAKLNVDEEQATAMKFGVQSIPTLILFKNGKLAEKLIGFMPKSQLLDKISKHF